MLWTYLKRELTNRARQTFVISSGLAVAIALVITIHSVSSGIQDSQSKALANLYGVGTDLTVTKTPVQGQGNRQRFAFGLPGQGQNSNQAVSNTRLVVARGQQLIDNADFAKISEVQGVKSTTGTLRLSNITFSGTFPITGQSNTNGSSNNPPNLNRQNRVGGDFNVDQFSIEGIDTSKTTVGPITSTKIVDGRAFAPSDKGQLVALMDQTYATNNSLKVGDSIKIKDTNFSIVGLVAPQTAATETESNVYVPLDEAQSLSGNAGITTVYIQAIDNSQVAGIKSSLSNSIAGVTVNSSADLASNISGSLETAASLVNGLGGWLSILVLLGAFFISILFTLSGVNRRIREFGTLKALGWKNARINKQILSESIVSGILGGVLGIALGLGGVAAINIWGPSLNASVSRFGNFGRNFNSPGGGFQGGGFQGGGMRQGRGGFGQAAQNVSTIPLHASPSLTMLLMGILFALAGSVIAGLIAGRRIVLLSPAIAMRSVA